MTKAQKETLEEKARIDSQIAEITNYFKPEDYNKSKDDEDTALRTQFRELSSRRKELEKLIEEFPKKEK